jgi:hypothetical protein
MRMERRDDILLACGPPRVTLTSKRASEQSGRYGRQVSQRPLRVSMHLFRHGTALRVIVLLYTHHAEVV